MLEPMQKVNDDFQKMGKDNYEEVLRSYGEMNKGFQAIAARVTDYSKKAFEDATRAFEQLAGAKSLEHVLEIQSQCAKKAYDSANQPARGPMQFATPCAGNGGI